MKDLIEEMIIKELCVDMTFDRREKLWQFWGRYKIFRDWLEEQKCLTEDLIKMSIELMQDWRQGGHIVEADELVARFAEIGVDISGKEVSK